MFIEKKIILQIVVYELTLTPADKLLTYMEYFVDKEGVMGEQFDSIEEQNHTTQDVRNMFQALPSSSRNLSMVALLERIERLESKQEAADIKLQSVIEKNAKFEEQLGMLIDTVAKFITQNTDAQVKKTCLHYIFIIIYIYKMTCKVTSKFIM